MKIRADNSKEALLRTAPLERETEIRTRNERKFRTSQIANSEERYFWASEFRNATPATSPIPISEIFFCFEVKTSEDDERCGFRVWSWFLLRFTPMIAWIQHHKFPNLLVIFSGLSSINKSFFKKIIVTNLFVLRRDA